MKRRFYSLCSLWNGKLNYSGKSRSGSTWCATNSWHGRCLRQTSANNISLRLQENPSGSASLSTMRDMWSISFKRVPDASPKMLFMWECGLSDQRLPKSATSTITSTVLAITTSIPTLTSAAVVPTARSTPRKETTSTRGVFAFTHQDAQTSGHLIEGVIPIYGFCCQVFVWFGSLPFNCVTIPYI